MVINPLITDESPWQIMPGAFGNSNKNIVIFNDFIDKKDLKIIQEFCPTINEWNNEQESIYAEDGTCLYDADYWNDRQCSDEILKRLNPQVWNLVEKYIVKMQLEVESFFKCKVWPRPPVIMRWRPGIEQRPHSDKQLNDGRPNAFPTYDLSSLFYYNDDYEGGEIYFPQHDIEIKPKAGMALMFVGDINYLHGVRMITSGFRFTTPSFYTVTRIGDIDVIPMQPK
jgi:hypothetical protein